MYMSSRITLEELLSLDYASVERYLANFLRSVLRASGKAGFVIGVSGGVDSATAYALAVRSVGADKVLALVMPDKEVTPAEDVSDAIDLVKSFGSRYDVVEISNIVHSFTESIPLASKREDRLAVGNLRARIRMCILYYYANALDMLVLGSSDRSEYLIGYFTKYGDGAVDIAPLTVLFKTQVRRFAEYLGVPKKIAQKPSAPRLWQNHLAEKELGMRYEDIDLVLFAFLDLGLPVNQISVVTGVSEEIVKRVLQLYSSSQHKRAGILMPDIKPVTQELVAKTLAKIKRAGG
jgi:NAD+ synthase